MIDDYHIKLGELLEPEDFELNERELSALLGEIPMTQELFNGCVSKKPITLDFSKIPGSYAHNNKKIPGLTGILYDKNQMLDIWV